MRKLIMRMTLNYSLAVGQMKAILHQEFEMAQAGLCERACYQRSRRQDPVASVAALALVGLLASAFAYLSPVIIKKQVSEPVVVTLLSLPQDPPPEQPQPVPQPDLAQPMMPPAAQVVTPPPLVTLPAPAAPAVQQLDVAKPTPPAPQLAPAPAAPVQTGPANGGDLSAQVVYRRPIIVPLESRRKREEGIVILSVLLGTDGRVSDIGVTTSSGFPRLDRAALEAVRDWRWSPLTRGGNAVMVRGFVRIPFIRDNGSGRDGGTSGRGNEASGNA